MWSGTGSVDYGDNKHVLEVELEVVNYEDHIHHSSSYIG